MEYNMLSNEIFMEYVWNIQVYGIYLTYAWYMTTSIMCIIHQLEMNACQSSGKSIVA